MTWEHHPVSLAGDRQDAQPHNAVISDSIVALFTGPWADIASSAFSAAIRDRSATPALAREAYQQAIDAIAAEWERREASCEDEFGMWGQRAAEGACLYFSGFKIHCHWLGATPVIHTRDRQIQSQNTPHTVYHAMAAAGTTRPNIRYHGVQLRSFVHEQQVDSATWTARDGDRVFLLPYTAKPTSLHSIAAATVTFHLAPASAVAEIVAPDCRPMATTLVMSELTPNSVSEQHPAAE